MLVLTEPPTSETSAPPRPLFHSRQASLPAGLHGLRDTVIPKWRTLLEQTLGELGVTREGRCAGSPLCRTEGVGPGPWPTLGLHVSASGRFQSRETHPQTIRGPCPAQPGAHTALSSLLPPSQPLGLPSPVVVVMGQGAACHRRMPVYLGSPTWSAQSALPEARPLERSCWACPLRGRPGCSEKCSERCSAPEGRFLWPFHIVLVCFPLKPCNSCNPCPARQPCPSHRHMSWA